MFGYVPKSNRKLVEDVQKQAVKEPNVLTNETKLAEKTEVMTLKIGVPDVKLEFPLKIEMATEQETEIPKSSIKMIKLPAMELQKIANAKKISLPSSTVTKFNPVTVNEPASKSYQLTSEELATILTLRAKQTVKPNTELTAGEATTKKRKILQQISKTTLNIIPPKLGSVGMKMDEAPNGIKQEPIEDYEAEVQDERCSSPVFTLEDFLVDS